MTLPHHDPNLTDIHLYHLRWSRTGRLQQALRGEGGHMAWVDVPHEEGAPSDPWWHDAARAERVREHNAPGGFGVTRNSARIVAHTLGLLREITEDKHGAPSNLYAVYRALDQTLLAVFREVLPVGEDGERRWPVG